MQAVLNEPRFANVETTWDFYLVVRSVTPRLKAQLRPANKPEGLYSEPTQYEHASVRAWTRTWSEILHHEKLRRELEKSGIDHDPSPEQALACLRHRHGGFIPGQQRVWYGEPPRRLATPTVGSASRVSWRSTTHNASMLKPTSSTSWATAKTTLCAWSEA
ncbi:hypothetical protein ACI3K5_33195 [Streptomyces sp. MPA0124]|uniref:hypothetical protein n=1 Tax=Streptomyces sp. MPA0124 TaxID=3378069 RepID=UPI00137D6AE9|nr:hypothetical protein [Streptomyces sp. SID6013]